MFSSIRVRIILILAVIGFSGWYLYSNYQQSGSIVKLGLDLQGGMHLVLEVDDPEGLMSLEARSDAIDRSERIIRNRIDELGVEEPIVQKVGQDRLIVELAGVDDEERARELVGQTAMLEWKLVRSVSQVQAALPRIDRAIVATLGADSLRAIGRDIEVSPEESDEVADLLFRTDPDQDPADPEEDPEEAVVDEEAEAALQELEAEADLAAEELALRPFTSLLLTSEGDGEFLLLNEDFALARSFLAMPEVQAVLPREISLQFHWEPVAIGGRLYRALYVLERNPFITGEMLEDASATRDQQFNQAIVQFQLSRAGGRLFGDVTGRHIGDRIAIVLDNEVVSAPVVRSRIGARGQIELGQQDMEEARDLALVLRAGALPAPLRIMEERTVGPSLGQDSIDQGMRAGLIGLVLIVLIMIAYYRFTGVLAVLALSVYVMLVLGGLAALNATLTLPGIAGLILSIGMAVDANVLIFERIREELAEGRAVRTAVDEGFGHALSAIVDANITTLITALILFQFGTGPVRGFAVTLSIGIIASFFTALYVTRSLYLVYLRGKKAQDTLSI
ncbi:MAG: protein translocase subunit SecD [Gemmatimonadales bacterium]|nr:MAG: protein translocase subunit SecD [Gemmatimonadales bacterium]